MTRMRSSLIGLSAIGCLLTLPSAADTDQLVLSVDQYAATLQSVAWKTSKIEACWSNPEVATAQDQQLVQEAVDSWNAASAIHINLNPSCVGVINPVKIQIEDTPDGPETLALGRRLANRSSPGVRLNFSFHNTMQICASTEQRRQTCIYNSAIHEFGHVLGLTHEQNRSDSPCKGMEQGPDPDLFLTVYDPNSVMNWCNVAIWSPDTKLSLSDFDKTAVAKLYGAHA